MKILFVSMNSMHFQRWAAQMGDSNHELYWFDILDQGHSKSLLNIEQITDWKKGFLKKRGRTFLKKSIPSIYRYLERRFDNSVSKAFGDTLDNIRPDIVHSFALFTSCLPILEVMNTRRELLWIYSSWGSDLFNQSNKPNYNKEVPAVLERVDYLITDCKRDYRIAKDNGFIGHFLGVIPGGGGFVSRTFNEKRLKNSFLIKGYENDLGKASLIIKGLSLLRRKYPDISIVIFGATSELVTFLNTEKNVLSLPVKILHNIDRSEVLSLMDQSYFYVGNSISDGMPNTLFEAIYAGCIPIQSNPGGATAELIKQGVNGYLIDEPTSENHIIKVLELAINSEKTLNDFYENNKTIRDRYERKKIEEEVTTIYSDIAHETV